MAVFFSPAKINFALKVLAKRKDGYHELSMLNGLLSLADEIDIEVAQGRGVSIKTFGVNISSDLDSPANNIAARAATLVLERSEIHAKVNIQITKRIPIGGGLGGGSSNAACVLAVLPHLLCESGLLSGGDVQVIRERLIEESVQLGADIPYFLKHSSPIAHVSGVGEIIEPLVINGIEALAVFLIIPDFALTTAEVFANCTEPPGEKTALYKKGLDDRTLDRNWLMHCMVNELLDSAIATDSRMAKLVKTGRSIRNIFFGMTGSGSTLFAVPTKSCEESDLISIRDSLNEAFSGHPVQIIQTNLLAKLSY